jgi:hypothetical protein
MWLVWLKVWCYSLGIAPSLRATVVEYGWSIYGNEIYKGNPVLRIRPAPMLLCLQNLTRTALGLNPGLPLEIQMI